MGKCGVSPIAYFQIQNFMNKVKEQINKGETNQQLYDEFIAQMGNVFVIDTSDITIQNQLLDVLKNVSKKSKEEKKFVSHVTSEFTKINNEAAAKLAEVEQKKYGHISKNPLDLPTSVVVENNISGRITDLDIYSPFSNRVSLAKNYFSNNTQLLKQYEQKVKRDIFRSAMVNYDIENAKSIKSNSDLTKNLMQLYNTYVAELYQFLIRENAATSDISNVVEDARAYFSSKYKKDNITDMLADGNFDAYINFVTLANGFDNVLGLYNLGVVHVKHTLSNNFDESTFGGDFKYTMSNANKFAFSYGNDNYSIHDETTDLIKTLFHTPPSVQNINGKWPAYAYEYLHIDCAMHSILNI